MTFAILVGGELSGLFIEDLGVLITIDGYQLVVFGSFEGLRNPKFFFNLDALNLNLFSCYHVSFFCPRCVIPQTEGQGEMNFVILFIDIFRMVVSERRLNFKEANFARFKI